MFVFILVTFFLAFSPSPNFSSPWFTNIFSLSSSSSGSTFSDESSRSHFSSVYYYFFPNSSQQLQNFTNPRSQNSNFEPLKNDSHDKDEVKSPLKPSVNVSTVAPVSSSGLDQESSSVKNQPQGKDFDDKNGVLKNPSKPSVNVSAVTPISSSGLNQESSKNQPKSKDFDDKTGNLKANQSKDPVEKSPERVNQTANSASKSGSGSKEKEIAEKGVKGKFHFFIYEKPE